MSYVENSVSVVIPTFNRREDLRLTLDKLAECSGPRCQIIIVDNGSSDGTREMIRSKFPNVELISLLENLGAESRDVGIRRANTEFVLLLDSDSHPSRGSIEAMVRHFRNHPDLGAAAFCNILPNQGNCQEVGGSYNVFIGCGCGFRRKLLEQVGGYANGYGTYVEEYDLSYRILEAGYEVRYFPDLVVQHRKSPNGRSLGNTLLGLTKNNILLYSRYFPAKECAGALSWVLYRYGKIAHWNGCEGAFYRGIAQGLSQTWKQRTARRLLPEQVLNKVVPRRFVAEKLKAAIAESKSENVLLWGIGKDFYPFASAAKKLGLNLIGAMPNQGQPYFAKQSSVFSVPLLPEHRLHDLHENEIIIASASPGEISNERAYLKNKYGISAPLVLFDS